MNSSEFDRRFDNGDAVLEVLDLDFPQWMVDQLDQEATRLGVTRQSIIKVWLSERLELRQASRPSPSASHHE